MARKAAEQRGLGSRPATGRAQRCRPARRRTVEPVPFDMTSAEALVLVPAAILAVEVFVEGRNGTLTPRVGKFLLALALLAAAAAVLHMEAW